MNMKIVITGSKGQLGNDCIEILKDKNELLCYDIEDLDITNFDVVDKVISRERPDIVLNCAAFTQVDDCEKQKELSYKINADGPSFLAESLKKNGGKLIHISTDYVFDGNKKVPASYSEDDITSPLSHYGFSKLEGERKIIEVFDNYLILRTAWVYGINGNNILKTILNLVKADSERELKVVNDQYGSPTWSYTLAKQIEHLIGKDIKGVYHATSEGYCTWYDFVKYFLDKMEVNYKMRQCTTEEYPTPASRPVNSILENKKLKLIDQNIMGKWQNDIDLFVEKYKERL